MILRGNVQDIKTELNATPLGLLAVNNLAAAFQAG